MTDSSVACWSTNLLVVAAAAWFWPRATLPAARIYAATTVVSFATAGLYHILGARAPEVVSRALWGTSVALAPWVSAASFALVSERRGWSAVTRRLAWAAAAATSMLAEGLVAARLDALSKFSVVAQSILMALPVALSSCPGAAQAGSSALATA